MGAMTYLGILIRRNRILRSNCRGIKRSKQKMKDKIWLMKLVTKLIFWRICSDSKNR